MPLLYAIGDLHLSLAADKPMDVFGGAWEDYTDKIKNGLSGLTADDTLLLCGDTSWGLSLSEAKADFAFLEQYPCRKLLLKGNHDYFWDTVAKMKRFFSDNGLLTFEFLHNNAYTVDGVTVCGTRGWFFEEEGRRNPLGAQPDVNQNTKMIARETGRLRTSLEEGRKLTDGELTVFLHYPPLYEGYRCDPLVDVMREFGVRRCFFGHLHGRARARAIEGLYQGIEYSLISADHVNFCPVAVKV